VFSTCEYRLLSCAEMYFTSFPPILQGGNRKGNRRARISETMLVLLNPEAVIGPH
jgi:hypothetical protein